MTAQQTDTDTGDLDIQDDQAEDEATAPAVELPLGIVLARILVVTGMSFSAAVAIFCAVGAIWEIAAIAALLTVVFVFLMFALERLAERQ